MYKFYRLWLHLLLFIFYFQCDVKLTCCTSIFTDLLEYQLRETALLKYGCFSLKKTERWLKEFNNDYLQLAQRLNEANWNYDTNLTNENALEVEKITKEVDEWLKVKVLEAQQEKNRLKQSLCHNKNTEWMLQQVLKSVIVSQNSAINSQLSEIGLQLSAMYGTASVEKAGKVYNLEPELEKIMATSRDYDELLWAWQSWHNCFGVQMRSLYTQFVNLQNEVAQESGYSDMGDLWLVQDFDDVQIANIMESLWQEVKPLYQQLHAFIRQKLIVAYPHHNLTENGPIPAHLFGNMWAQNWVNIEDMVKPDSLGNSADITQNLIDQNYTPNKMFRLAESFFTSLSLPNMTDIFWQKSEIVRPNDRPFQCHAAAYDMMKKNDYRIKMCTEVTKESLLTIHHEMGHIEYYMLYNNQPTIYRTGANAAFHEAIGDTIGLFVQTVPHLQHIGLLSISSGTHKHKNNDISYLLNIALQKVAFLPFGYFIDKWRWDVFAGKINDSNYNEMWWRYRRQYQGIIPPVARTEQNFDPGAKYHIPSNTPYSRYFLSGIAQFQFLKGLCDTAGHTGPLHHCDIYKSTKAGNKLRAALSLGSSKPWSETLKILTGTDRFSAKPLLNYFEPLYTWLQQQNADSAVGW